MSETLKPETVVTFALPLTVIWGIVHTVFKGYQEGQKAKAQAIAAEQERDRAAAENAKEIAHLHKTHADQIMQDLKTTVRHIEGKIGEMMPELVINTNETKRNTEEIKELRKILMENLGAMKSAIGQLSQYWKPKA